MRKYEGCSLNGCKHAIHLFGNGCLRFFFCVAVRDSFFFLHVLMERYLYAECPIVIRQMEYFGSNGFSYI